MLLKKAILSIIGLVLVIFAVFGLLKLASHPKAKELRIKFKDRPAALRKDLFETAVPSRKHPLTTIELEENLKVNLPVPFANFSQKDWQWFWHLIYGSFREDADAWPERKRQLTQQEIQNELVDYYYRPFGSFKQRQWDIFWQHILKGKVF